MTDHTAPESIGQGATVRDFASSEMFERTFAEGMQLVEETAAYLDGVGRKESKLLSRNAALVYAGESMRLTTRLMQIASWLLVQRAVREGDMAATEASQERYRIRESEEHRDQPSPALDGLPEGLLSLLDRSERLHERVAHLDRRMYAEGQAAEAANPVQSQLDRLRTAFGG